MAYCLQLTSTVKKKPAFPSRTEGAQKYKQMIMVLTPPFYSIRWYWEPTHSIVTPESKNIVHHLFNFRQSFKHEAKLADSRIQKLGHQAEADMERQLHFQGQLLCVQECPVVWNWTERITPSLQRITFDEFVKILLKGEPWTRNHESADWPCKCEGRHVSKTSNHNMAHIICLTCSNISK